MPAPTKPDRFRTLTDDIFDAVVVGAGTGGLTCAALLAGEGMKVLVIDQHYVAGGCATIFRRPGYEFDVGLHYVGECGPRGAMTRILKGCGADVEMVEMDPDGFDIFHFPDLTFRVPKGYDRYRDRLVEYFPEEIRGIDRYMSALNGLGAITGGKLSRLLQNPMGVARLAWYSTSTLSQFLDTCTKNPLLRAVIAGQNGDYGLPPEQVAFPMHLALVGHYLKGAYFPREGGQATSDALAASIEARGGKILLRAEARRIHVEGGRATGVTLFNPHVGERRVNARFVVSGADLKKTLLELVQPGTLPESTLDRTRNYRMAPALAVLYLGLKRDLRAEKWPAANHWIFPSADMSSAYVDAQAERFSDRPFAYLSVASLKAPDHPRLAPPGHTNLQIMTLAPASPEAWGVTPEQVADGSYRKAEAYLARKAALSRALLREADRIVPGLAQQVVFQEMSTPLTHGRYTRASGNTSYGIAAVPSQFLWNRPDVRTSIRGLYLCGASTRAGHGIMGALISGVLAASAIVGPSAWRKTLGGRG